MNYYEQRLALLDRDTLPKDVFGDGNYPKKTNEEWWNEINIGDKIFVTVWFLRDIYELENVADIAKNGLTVIEKGHIYDPEGKWGVGGWEGKQHNVLFFKEGCLPMSFKYVISQFIWKHEPK